MTSSSASKDKWENIKLMITYGVSGMIVIFLFQSMFHREHGTLDRLNLNKRSLPIQGTEGILCNLECCIRPEIRARYQRSEDFFDEITS